MHLYTMHIDINNLKKKFPNIFYLAFIFIEFLQYLAIITKIIVLETSQITCIWIRLLLEAHPSNSVVVDFDALIETMHFLV